MKRETGIVSIIFFELMLQTPRTLYFYVVLFGQRLYHFTPQPRYSENEETRGPIQADLDGV